MHAEAQHELSGESLRTDAPLEHEGKSQNFAPTDLVATALGTCFITIMGIKAKQQGWKLGEINIEVNKIMTKSKPRKIESISLHIKMPPGLRSHQLRVLQKATEDCPVLHNLKDSIKIKIIWVSKKKESLKFFPTHVFRETPKVTFFDAGIDKSNSSDVVIHHGDAVSPPNNGDDEMYYVHHHQIDHNLVLEGSRTFTLLNPEWDEPHHVIFLNPSMGSLQIPINTYHRSISGTKGSMVLNQAIRDEEFDKQKEFKPISLRSSIDLKIAKSADPVYWLWDEGKVKRVKSGGKHVQRKCPNKLKKNYIHSNSLN